MSGEVPSGGCAVSSLYEMNRRRGPGPLPADDITLVESLRFAVPLWIVEMRDASPGDLVRTGLRCAWAVGERGASLMFRVAGDPSASERDSAALAFEGLARGLAAVCLMEDQADFAGLHWCVRAHEGCPTPRALRREPAPDHEVKRVAALLDEFEALLTAAGERP